MKMASQKKNYMRIVFGAVNLKTHILLDALPTGTARVFAFLPHVSVFPRVVVGWGGVGLKTFHGI